MLCKQFTQVNKSVFNPNCSHAVSYMQTPSTETDTVMVARQLI